MILLFSAFGVDRPLHKRDLLNICCEAEGAHLTFSYRTARIANGLRRAHLRDRRLEGEQALIIFNEVVAEKNEFVFHPMRRATIARHVQEYDAATFALILDQFVTYSSDAAERKSFLSEFLTYVDRSPERPQTIASQLPSYYVREEKTHLGALRFGDAWSPLVGHLKACRGFEDVILIVPQSDASGSGPSTLFDGCQYDDGRAKYSIVSGTSKELTVQLIPGAGARIRAPELVVKEAVATVSGPFMRQRSEGFEAKFIISFRRSFQKETSMLLLRLPLGDGGVYVSPEHQAWIHLSVSRKILIGTILLLVSGSFFMSIGPDVVKEVGTDWMKVHTGWMVTLAKLGGAAGLALGSFLGFQKLPFK